MPETLFNGLEGFVSEEVKRDQDISAFCRYYEARRFDELAKAGGDDRRRNKVESDLTPKVYADVVAMQAVRYDIVQVTVAFTLDDERRYEIELELLPASRQVVSEPERRVCEATGRRLPVVCLRDRSPRGNSSKSKDLAGT